MPRVNSIDVARTIALLAMAIYHFSWDLSIFGYASPEFPRSVEMIVFARCIAGSFIGLAGVSLVLAHGEGVRWRSFAKRLVQIVAAAIIVTVATLFAFPDAYIFFGILHLIAAASVLGLFFLRAPWFVSAAAGAFFVALPIFFRSDLFAAGPLLWIGLSETRPISNDYVPIFPWFGIYLIGMAIGRAGRSAGWFERLARSTMDRHLPHWLAWPGRHSLSIYLIHQPVLLGLVWLAVQISPPQISAAAEQAPCEQACLAQSDAEFCTRYCGCILESLEDAELLGLSATSEQLTADQRGFVDSERQRCVRAAESVVKGGNKPMESEMLENYMLDRETAE